jgi:hypothetical protein
MKFTRGPGQCKKITFEWDPRTIYDDLEHLLFEPYMWYQRLFMTPLTWENAYMWDRGKFYDDLEHSIFEKNAYMWDPTKFMTTWNPLFLK